MGSKIYVGNLSYNVTSADLNTLFTPHGQVQSAEVIQDRESGRSKGFGFVQMGTDEEAQKAIAAISGGNGSPRNRYRRKASVALQNARITIPIT